MEANRIALLLLCVYSTFGAPAPKPAPQSDFVDNGYGGAYNVVSIPSDVNAAPLDKGGDELTDTVPKKVLKEREGSHLKRTGTSDTTGFEKPSGLFKCATCNTANSNSTKKKCNCGPAPTPAPLKAPAWREDDVYLGPYAARTNFVSRSDEFRWAKEMVVSKPVWPTNLLATYARYQANMLNEVRDAQSKLREVERSPKTDIVTRMDAAQTVLELLPNHFKELDEAKLAVEAYMKDYDEAMAAYVDYVSRNPQPTEPPAAPQ